jgi:hypothetical protein
VQLRGKLRRIAELFPKTEAFLLPDMYDETITAADIRSIATLTKLHHLSLHCGLLEEDYASTQEFTSLNFLTRLSLYASTKESQLRCRLDLLTQLRVLEIQSTDPQIGLLPSSPVLTKLGIVAHSLQPPAVEELAKLTQLRDLSVIGPDNPTEFDEVEYSLLPLTTLTQLETVAFEVPTGDLDDAIKLASHLPTLSSVSLSGGIIYAPTPLNNLPSSLTNLSLGQSCFDTDRVDWFRQFGHLHKLKHFSTPRRSPISETFFFYSLELPELSHLELSGYLTDIGYESFLGFTALRKLDLWDAPPESGLPHSWIHLMTRLQNLRSLRFNIPPERNPSLATTSLPHEFTRLTQLHELHLRVHYLQVPLQELISHLPYLRSLFLAFTSAAQVEFSLLRRLTSLQELMLESKTLAVSVRDTNEFRLMTSLETLTFPSRLIMAPNLTEVFLDALLALPRLSKVAIPQHVWEGSTREPAANSPLQAIALAHRIRQRCWDLLKHCQVLLSCEPSPRAEMASAN